MSAYSLFQKSPASQQIFLMLTFAIASVVGSFIFACATPFAAVATAAALTLSKRNAFVLVFAVWIINQAIGYGFLNYPQTADSYIWGVAIGAGALVSLIVAQFAANNLCKTLNSWAIVATVFAAAFVAYELTLFAVALTPLGGLSGFTPDVIWAVFLSNLLGLVVAIMIDRVFLVTNGERKVATQS